MYYNKERRAKRLCLQNKDIWLGSTKIYNLPRNCKQMYLIAWFYEVKTKKRVTNLIVTLFWFLGNVLSFQAVASQVFSTMRSLTSVFGMGTGGSFSLLSPRMAQSLF